MNDDLEKLLNQVGTPIESLSRNRLLLRFRVKFLKVCSAIIVVVVVILLFIRQEGNQSLKIQRPGDIKTGNKIVDQVAKLIVLPDEKPVVATIVKAELLKNNKFFAEANNGDQVLFFKKADKAILYDPTLQHIKNIGSAKNLGIDFE